MFVKLVDGNEPIYINPEQVTRIEGLSGGQHCVVYSINGAVRIAKPADEIVTLLDWAAPSKEKKDARR